MNEFVEALDRLLAHACTPDVVRAIELGGPAMDLWATLEESGFADAMVAEAQGGAGLTLAGVFGLFVAEGRHAVPLPLGHTMVARAALAAAGAQVPQGAIAIAPWAECDDAGQIACRNVPWGCAAQWIVAALPGRWLLLPTETATRAKSGIHAGLHADLRWAGESAATFSGLAPSAWREAGAVVTAAQMVGALERALDMTLQFANDRVQFGRSIGKFQAIQHQLAVMAEQVAAARMAAQIGCHAAQAFPNPLRAALAKARVSEAAALVAPLAHAIHGAIGVTAELDLQLFTRRLHAGRADFGSETLWNRELGRALLASGQRGLDFMRAALLPT